MTTLIRSLALAILCLHAPLVARAGDEGFTVSVKKGRCREEIVAQGELRAANTVNIHAPEMEEHYLSVKSVLESGAAVKKGDVVMEMDDALYQLALKAASQELDLRRAQRELARFQLDDELIKNELEIKRKEVSVAKAEAEVVRDATIVSPVERRKAELSVELAQLELAQAKTNRVELGKKRDASLKVKDLEVAEAQRKVDQTRESLVKIVVRAPKDGVIYKPFVRLNNEKGRVERNKVVRPGDKLLEIPSFDRFEGVCYLSAADMRFVRPGDPVSVRLAVKPQQPVTGRVLRKDPYPMTRNERLGRDDAEGHLKEFEMVIEVQGTDDAFRPGSTFTATISATLADDALFVPQAAVHADASGSASVFTPAASGPVRVPVTVGPTGFTWAVIQSGLTAGQTVLLGVDVR
jgi:multidrug efflux pump subunit AcrA (membrane-fusion protein)